MADMEQTAVTEDVDMGDPTDDESDTQPETAKVKRHRTSPRVKVLDQVLSMIDSHIKGGVDTEKFPTIEALLSDMRGRVQDLAAMDPTSNAPKYAGRHYVGVTANGARSHFQANNPPTKRNIGEKFASVVGPFRTKEGAEYVVTNGVRETDKVVF